MKHYIFLIIGTIFICQHALAITLQPIDCRSVTSCPSGQERTCIPASHCPGGEVCTCTIPMITCDSSNCTSDTSWTTGNTGYVYKKQRACDFSLFAAGSCNVTNTIRGCAAGYYGKSNSTGTSGCTQCPPHPDATTGTFYTLYPLAGNSGTTQADCGFRPGVLTRTFSNTKGTYRYTDTCYYSVD